MGDSEWWTQECSKIWQEMRKMMDSMVLFAYSNMYIHKIYIYIYRKCKGVVMVRYTEKHGKRVLAHYMNCNKDM